jgi:hypothetical protein
MSRSKDLDTIAPDDLVVKSDEDSISTTVIASPKTKPKKSNISNSQESVNDILYDCKSSLCSFLINPKAFDFPEREEDEKIYLTIRSHWLVNIKWVSIAILMVIVPIFFNFLDFFSSMPLKYRIISTIFWYILTFIYSFEHFISWYFDVFIITDRRLVDIRFNNLLNKHFAEVDFARIQDVSSSIKGILATFFNFGDVLVQTASEINQMTLRKVPKPEKIIKLLQEIRSDNSEVNKGD